MLHLSTAVQRIGYYSWDFASDLVRVDNVCCEIFEFEVETAAEGMPIKAFLDKMDPETQERIAAAIYKSISNDEYYDETYTIGLKSGRERWIRVTGRCMLSGGQLPTHSAGTMMDVTHLRTSF